jgi:hypothetical protein
MCFLHALIALMMEALSTSETSVYSESTRRHIPESCNLHTCRRENLPSHTEYIASDIKLTSGFSLELRDYTGTFSIVTYVA